MDPGASALRSSLTRSPAHSAFLRRNTRDLPPHLQAITILLPRRNYATETSTSNIEGAGYPPPGFNADEAKKRLPSDEPEQPATSKGASDAAASIAEDTTGGISKAQATGAPKTKATEDRSLSELAADKEASTQAE